MTEFQFINIASSPEGKTQDEAARRLIRRNAMLAYHREKDPSRSDNPQQRSGTKSSISRSQRSQKKREATDSGEESRGLRQQKRRDSRDRRATSKGCGWSEEDAPTNQPDRVEISDFGNGCSLPDATTRFGSPKSRPKAFEIARMFSRPQLSIPRPLPHTGPVDPFSSTAMSMNYRTQSLLYRFLGIPQTIYPTKSYQGFTHSYSFILKMATSDEALLHAIIAYSSMHEACYGRRRILASPSQMTEYVHSDSEFLSHQLQAVQLVNNKLKEGIVSDALIATVLILVWRQVWTGGTEDTEAHFKGLQDMVKFRGGMESIPRPLAMAIYFTNSKHAARTHSRPAQPEFPSNFQLVKPPDIKLPDLGGALRLDCDFPNLKILIGEELYDIVRDFYYYAALIKYYRLQETQIRPRHGEYFNGLNTSIDHRLLSYPNLDLKTGTFDDIFLDAVRTSVVLWMNAGFWLFQPATAIIRSMTSHLANLLSRTDLRQCQEACPDLLLWIFVIGGCSSIEAAPRLFFVTSLKEHMLAARVRSQQAIEQILKKFLYLDGVYEVALERLWEEMYESVKEDIEEIT